MSHPQTNRRWTAWVGTQGFLVIGQRPAVVLLVEGNAGFTKQRWYVVICLGKDENIVMFRDISLTKFDAEEYGISPEHPIMISSAADS